MKAFGVGERAGVDGNPLHLVENHTPTTTPGELLVSVQACGVCRTDLHVVERDLPVHRPHVVPRHEIVGLITEIGENTETHFRVGDVVGIPWLRHTCGTCRFCIADRENLCLASLYTGWDHDGGWAVVPADYALTLPPGYSNVELAPLLCAGIIGYRALCRAELPTSGKLGLYGFGASAHIVAQLAQADGATVHVMTRDEDARELALRMGLASAQNTFHSPPEKLDAAINFAPIGEAFPPALEAIDSGGTVVLAGIHMTDVPSLDYNRQLFHEKRLLSVEANTRADAREFLERCRTTHLKIETTVYKFDRALSALCDLHHGRFAGAAVITL